MPLDWPGNDPDDILEDILRQEVVGTDSGRQERVLAEVTRQLEAAKLEAGKPARRLMAQLCMGLIRQDPTLPDIYPVSCEDAVRLAVGRLLRFVGLGEKASGSI